MKRHFTNKRTRARLSLIANVQTNRETQEQRTERLRRMREYTREWKKNAA